MTRTTSCWQCSGDSRRSSIRYSNARPSASARSLAGSWRPSRLHFCGSRRAFRAPRLSMSCSISPKSTPAVCGSIGCLPSRRTGTSSMCGTLTSPRPASAASARRRGILGSRGRAMATVGWMCLTRTCPSTWSTSSLGPRSTPSLTARSGRLAADSTPVTTATIRQLPQPGPTSCYGLFSSATSSWHAGCGPRPGNRCGRR
mmetsp:Transcript_18503/g.60581  ORF Transcript_18503/g.60581 Transcript_18503/m.60581 type:complete len:201 (-) Transcript_18503:2901-3503(-)